MAFGAQKIFPIDTKPGTAVGTSLNFNDPGVFLSTYTTKDAIKNNLINFFLTNRTERYLNPNFGGDLRKYIFEQIFKIYSLMALAFLHFALQCLPNY